MLKRPIERWQTAPEELLQCYFTDQSTSTVVRCTPGARLASGCWLAILQRAGCRSRSTSGADALPINQPALRRSALLELGLQTSCLAVHTPALPAVGSRRTPSAVDVQIDQTDPLAYGHLVFGCMSAAILAILQSMIGDSRRTPIDVAHLIV